MVIKAIFIKEYGSTEYYRMSTALSAYYKARSLIFLADNRISKVLSPNHKPLLLNTAKKTWPACTT